MAEWENVPLDPPQKKKKQRVNLEPPRPMAARLMSFDMNDGYVNTLTVADFNLFPHAIQGDTHRFKRIERFIKGLITWRISARAEISARSTGLKFCCDYMTNFSPG